MDPQTAPTLDYLVQQIKDLTDAFRNHKHTGYDLTSKLYGTTISKAVFVDNLSLGDGLSTSGTLTLKRASGRGSVYILGGALAAGDFANTGGNAGFILGEDDADTLDKFYFGKPTSYIKYDGSELTVLGRVSSLGMRAFTNFETAARFISTLGGSGSNTFGNQGVTVAPGATGTSYARLLWWITQYVFNNNPIFTCSILALSGFATGDGRAYIGLGAPTISGSAIAVTGINYAGFLFQKVTNVTTLVASQCDGSGNRASANLITVTNGDSLELFVKMNATSIQYFYRKNGGALTLGATLTTFMPTGSETYIMFGSTNSASTDDFQVQLQCASYEH